MSEYRVGARRCPACAVPMEGRAAGQAELDVCPDCSGAWVDWTDGELSHVTRRMGPLPRPRPAEARAGTWSCPDCQTPLVSQEAHPGGLPLYRCGECGGAFLPLATLRDVAKASPTAEPTTPDETPTLTRLLDTLYRWFVG